MSCIYRNGIFEITISVSNSLVFCLLFKNVILINIVNKGTQVNSILKMMYNNYKISYLKLSINVSRLRHYLADKYQ